MVRPAYIPGAGDLVWASFDPQAVHEQAGRRPALVLSPSEYNGKVGLVLACPITSHRKGYPFEVNLTGKRIKGVVLADQLRSLDWRARQLTFIEHAEADAVVAVKELLQTLLGMRPE